MYRTESLGLVAQTTYNDDAGRAQQATQITAALNSFERQGWEVVQVITTENSTIGANATSWWVVLHKPSQPDSPRPPRTRPTRWTG